MANMDLNIFLLAARNGDIFVMKKHLDNGIDIHTFNDLALRLTVKFNHSKATIFLLARGANINAVYDAELRDAALKGETDKVKLLLEEYPCSDDAKLYAMYNAIFGRHEDIINLLLPFAHNEAVLNVVKFCNNEKVNALFKEYLD